MTNGITQGSFFLLCSIVLGTAALDVPESFVWRVEEKSEERQLQTCSYDLNICYDHLGAQTVPLEQWSELLSTLSGDAAGVLDMTRALVEQTVLIDFQAFSKKRDEEQWIAGAVVTIGAIAASLFGLSALIGGPRDDVFSAVGEGVLSAVDGLGDFFDHVADVFFSIINGIIGIIVNIWNGLVYVVHFIKNAIWDLLWTIWDWLVRWATDFTRGLNHALTHRIPFDSACQTELTQCQFNLFLSEAVPRLLTLSFLTAGAESQNVAP